MSQSPEPEATDAYNPAGSILPTERFAPGAVLAGRYRVVALLGKGGMGEVYRADDLTLGQPVALKFLPLLLAIDPDRLARFRQEVVAARKVSHPNVCRVYDIAELDGQSFLTMEYVDGEDLSSVLARLGRVPEEKGIEIARQLCSALSAVHDQGLLHRDLKPANVMLDGRGKVRLTDFGLAVAAENLSATQVRSGTPLYMAPEQAAGREVTVRSDLFALGLVLYELFTGRRAFAGAKRDIPPPLPSSHVTGLSPSVEAVILRCLKTDPASRPKSAVEVLAELPGGDPLAAALAAGQMPSPQVVADAPVEGTLRPAIALTLLVVVLAGIALTAVLNDRVKLFRRAPFRHSPTEMCFQARQMLGRFGYPDPPADACWGIEDDEACLVRTARDHPGEERWAILATGQPPASYFWYRQGTRPLEATRLGYVTPTDPPLTTPGMAAVFLDIKGRLIEFHAVPPPVDAPGPKAIDWSPVFAAAGLELAKFHPTDSPVRHVAPGDSRFVWTGEYPDRPGIAARVEALSFQGRPVYFRVIEGSETATDVPRAVAKIETGADGFSFAFWLISLALTAVAAAIARRNYWAGRTDLRGGTRFALAIGIMQFVYGLLGGHHIVAAGFEQHLFTLAIGNAAFSGGSVFVCYLAIEPGVRRRWPWRIISWNRLLDGRWRDPLVGRDVLIGGAVSAVCGLMYYAINLYGTWAEVPMPVWPAVLRWQTVPSNAIPHTLLDNLTNRTLEGVLFFSLLFVVTFLTRRLWVGTTVTFVIAVLLLSVVDTVTGPLTFAVRAIDMACLCFLALRYGLLACVGYGVLGSWHFLPITYDLTTWHWPASLAYFGFEFAIGMYAFVVVLGGFPILGREELGDG